MKNADLAGNDGLKIKQTNLLFINSIKFCTLFLDWTDTKLISKVLSDWATNVTLNLVNEKIIFILKYRFLDLLDILHITITLIKDAFSLCQSYFLWFVLKNFGFGHCLLHWHLEQIWWIKNICRLLQQRG